MKKIYFHITFLVLFILFALFTYRINSCFFDAMGCWGSAANHIVGMLSIFVLFLSLLTYFGYLVCYFLGIESRFLKTVLYSYIFILCILFIYYGIRKLLV